MLTVEYRVNGKLIGFTNIHNEGWLPTGNKCRYSYIHLHDNNSCCGDDIIHARDDGFEPLVAKVLKDILKKGKSSITSRTMD